MASNSLRKVDWVKYLGIAAAVLIFLAGQQYLARRAADRHRQYLDAQARAQLEEQEQRARQRAEEKLKGVKREEIGKAEQGPPGPPQPPEPPPPPPPPPPPVEAVPAAPDIQATGDHLDLLFTARGGAIKRAGLVDVKVLASSQTMGLELLNEIHPGWLSLALVSLKYGPAETPKSEPKVEPSLCQDLESRVWKLTENSQGFQGDPPAWTVAYETTVLNAMPPYAPQARITKRFRLRRADRYVDLSIEVTNLSGQGSRFEYALRGPAGILIDGPPEDPRQAQYVNLRAALAGRAVREDEPTVMLVAAAGAGQQAEEKRKVGAEENLWAALSNRFFLAALIARDPRQIMKIVAEPIAAGLRQDRRGDLRYLEENLAPVFHRLKTTELAANANLADRYIFYMGPSDEGILSATEAQLGLERPAHLNLSVQYCDVFNSRWPNVDRVARFLLWIFRHLGWLSGSLGLAVILLTLVVKLALHPLQRKMTVSMHRMQQLQPQLKAIEDKYAGQTKPEMRQKKEMEKYNLMRKSGVNPTMGCLPMLLQMPILFALYGAFSRAFEIRQAGFLWIHDLSLADRLMRFGFWPHELNLLPIMYAGFSLYQGLRQPKPPGADSQQELNRKMMTFMPVVFAFLFYRLPSGLILYFAASAVFGLIETWYVRHFVLKVDAHGNPLPGQPPATAKNPQAKKNFQATGRASKGQA
jgi:YidC/Oxa1 family membrane protein insertase